MKAIPFAITASFAVTFMTAYASPAIAELSCSTSFDNPQSFARIYGGWTVYGLMTKFGPSGELVSCGSGSTATSDESCMGYNEPCGTSWLEVRPAEPSVWRVFALGFDNFSRLCTLPDVWELGYRPFWWSPCKRIPNISTQGRKYVQEISSDWHRITRRTSLGGGFAQFNLKQLTVLNAPIQLWFQLSDGSVLGWDRLDPAAHDFGNQISNATYVWIGPAIPNHDKTFTLDSVRITVN